MLTSIARFLRIVAEFFGAWQTAVDGVS